MLIWGCGIADVRVVPPGHMSHQSTMPPTLTISLEIHITYIFLILFGPYKCVSIPTYLCTYIHLYTTSKIT